MILKIFHIKTFMIMVLVAGMATGGVCFAENKLPEIMVGQTQLTVNGQTVYGGTVGNEVILNYDPNLLDGGKLLGFDQSILVEPCKTILPSDASCYKLDPDTTSMKLMTSRTNVNGSDVLEISTLLYPNITIVGDVYGGSGGFSNFALYGRNLNKNSSAINGTWNVSGYSMNTQAQAYYATDSASKIYFDKHISDLRGEAFAASSINVAPWNLQNNSDTALSGTTDDSTKYPEGKVWEIGTSTLTSSPSYKGLGTLIVDGNLTLASGKSITRDSGSGKALGIIVTGNLILNGNNKIDAAVFVAGNIQVGNNVEATGSFVASDFRDSTGGTLDDNYGIRFIYDYKLENNWPPGFRFFNMPSPENVAP